MAYYRRRSYRPRRRYSRYARRRPYRSSRRRYRKRGYRSYKRRRSGRSRSYRSRRSSRYRSSRRRKGFYISQKLIDYYSEPFKALVSLAGQELTQRNLEDAPARLRYRIFKLLYRYSRLPLRHRLACVSSFTMGVPAYYRDVPAEAQAAMRLAMKHVDKTAFKFAITRMEPGAKLTAKLLKRERRQRRYEEILNLLDPRLRSARTNGMYMMRDDANNPLFSPGTQGTGVSGLTNPSVDSQGVVPMQLFPPQP